MAGGLLRTTKELQAVLPASAGAGGGVAVPFEFIFTGEDGLLVTVVNRRAGARIKLTARWLGESDAHVQALEYAFTPTSDGFASTFSIALPRGVLLNLVVRAFNTGVEYGQCYVRVDVVRGQTAHTTLGTLVAGSVGSETPRAWPGTPLLAPIEGPGYAQLKLATPPAAGSAAVVSVPNDVRWRVMAAIAVLVTSGAAGIREPFVYVTLGGANTFFSPSSLTQGPGLTKTHTWGAGLAHAPGSGTIVGQGGLPSPFVIDCSDGSTSLTFDAVGLLAGDQVTSFYVHVEEWVKPSTAYSL